MILLLTSCRRDMYNFGAIDPHILQQVSDDNTANKRQKYIFQNLLITPKPWKM